MGVEFQEYCEQCIRYGGFMIYPLLRVILVQSVENILILIYG